MITRRVKRGADMDGIHDLGGTQGFGRIDVEADEPTFHQPWQRTTFALMMATQIVMRSHNTDEYRHAIERMQPAHYLLADYYERVLTGTVSLLVEKGYLSQTELEQRAGGVFELAGPVAEQPMVEELMVEELMADEHMVELAPQLAPRFSVGDRVRVLTISPAGHTRAPKFCRGHQGTVIHRAPQFRFPNTSAHGGERRKEHTYHVEFASTDLWSDDRVTNDSVIVDLWDSYLEAAS